MDPISRPVTHPAQPKTMMPMNHPAVRPKASSWSQIPCHTGGTGKPCTRSRNYTPGGDSTR